MGSRDDDRNSRSSMRNAGGPARSGEPGRVFEPFDHYRHGPNESPYEGGYPRDGYERDGGFLIEDRFGHTPGQRWSGGYGGDRDRYQADAGRGAGPGLGGRGFTGSDFQGSRYDRDYDHERHFGNAVDRAGRMGHGGEGTGYGFHGTDMGMGAPEIDRGPHYGKGPKGYKRSDDRTREDVCDAIAHFGHVDASDVEVNVKDGIVTLSGTVAHRRDKRALEHVAERCRGVHDIHNELRLKRNDGSDTKDANTNGKDKNGRTAPT